MLGDCGCRWFGQCAGVVQMGKCIGTLALQRQVG